MAGGKSPSSDFDPSDLVKQDDFKLLADRIETLEKKIISQEAFADTFCSVHERDVKVRKEIAKNISEFVKTDADFKDDMAALIRKIDRGYVNTILGRFGVALWSLALVVITSLLTTFVNSYISSPQTTVASDVQENGGIKKNR